MPQPMLLNIEPYEARAGGPQSGRIRANHKLFGHSFEQFRPDLPVKTFLRPVLSTGKTLNFAKIRTR